VDPSDRVTSMEPSFASEAFRADEDDDTLKKEKEEVVTGRDGALIRQKLLLLGQPAFGDGNAREPARNDDT